MNHIEVDRVSKTFGERIVIDDLSLQIQKAERLVLFGPSGSGKDHRSAPCRRPGSSRQRRDSDRRSNCRKRRKESRSAGETGCRNGVSGSRAVASYDRAAESDVRSQCAETFKSARPRFASARCLQRVGLEHRIDAKPHQLSGGEQQRVALARALVSRPSILLMDEPLSSLDDERKRAIASDLLGLQSQFGFTLIYVTHDRNEADMLASRVCQLRDGRVAEGSK